MFSAPSTLSLFFSFFSVTTWPHLVAPRCAVRPRTMAKTWTGTTCDDLMIVYKYSYISAKRDGLCGRPLDPCYHRLSTPRNLVTTGSATPRYLETLRSSASAIPTYLRLVCGHLWLASPCPSPCLSLYLPAYSVAFLLLRPPLSPLPHTSYRTLPSPGDQSRQP